MRIDHGRMMLGDEDKGYNPGYSFYGRMLALAQVEGMMTVVDDEIKRQMNYDSLSPDIDAKKKGEVIFNISLLFIYHSNNQFLFETIYFFCPSWKSGIRFTSAPFITPFLIASLVSEISFLTRL